MPNSERSGRVEPWQQAFVDAYAKLEPGEIMLRSRWQRRTVDDLMIDMLTTYRMAMATSESFRRLQVNFCVSTAQATHAFERMREAFEGFEFVIEDPPSRLTRILCALIGHPWLDYANDRDVKVCPCGKSEITITHLMAAWPGEDPLCREP